MTIKIWRIYEHSSAGRGYRVLVDRLWPRGVTKDIAALDEWNKEVSPSNDLRKWFDHDVDKWPEFRRKYLHELAQNKKDAQALLERAGKNIILLYGAKDEQHTHALVLKEYLEKLRRPVKT